MAATQTILEDYLKELLGEDKAKQVEANDDLLDSGVIDSVNLVRLIHYVETKFQISISEDDIDENNFSTTDRIAAFVDRKLGTTPT